MSTTLASAFSNMFSTLGERQRQRYISEPVNSHDEEQPATSASEAAATTTTTSTNNTDTSPSTAAAPEANNNSTEATSSENVADSTTGTTTRSSSTAVNMVEVSDDDDEDDPFMSVTAALRRSSTGATDMEDDDEDDDMEEIGMDDDDDDMAMNNNNDGIFVLRNAGNNMTLAELEDERELARRRSSACVMLAVFVLFRLWISCLQEGDFTLLLLCLLGTSWTVRWIRYNREREEELDRRIEQYVANARQAAQNGEAGAQGSGENGAEDTITTPSGVVVNRNDLRMLSFQAQLSLAIMESQRHMMEGGFGRPDGQQANAGVSEQAKALWRRFPYQAPTAAEDAAKNNSKAEYGSVSKEKLSSLDCDDADLPHCSICLGEYEDGEPIVQLPCQHLYHDSCISSWTESHVKCPLCNMDLESVTDAADGSEGANHSNTEEGSDSIV